MENKLENNKKPEKPKKKKDSIFKYFLHDFVWGIGSVFGYIWFRPKKYYISEAAKKVSQGTKFSKSEVYKAVQNTKE